MKNFKELRIWEKGMDIAVKCFRLTDKFPKEEKFGLSLQITRAGVSIPSNIAEGSSRSSEKEYLRFVEIALGSAYELETQLLIAQRVNYRDQELMTQVISEINDEQKMLMGFAKKLKQ